MTDKKKAPGRPKSRPPRKPYVIQLRTDDADLIEALKRVSARNHRTANAEIIVALEAHLASEGDWPPKSKDTED